MKNEFLGWRIKHARGDPGLFPPEVIVTVKALACELPARTGLPLARWSMSELAAETQRTGLVASISGSTIWRWLHVDAIRPWFHRSWIFPRDPEFASKAGRILDLYERVWEAQPLTADEFVISADEKTSIQARRRCHATEPPRAGAVMKVEHEYERAGAWAYLAALDVHHARLFGRCEPTPHEKYVYELLKPCTKPLVGWNGPWPPRTDRAVGMGCCSPKAGALPGCPPPTEIPLPSSSAPSDELSQDCLRTAPAILQFCNAAILQFHRGVAGSGCRRG